MCKHLIIYSMVGVGVATASDCANHCIGVSHCCCERTAARTYNLLSTEQCRLGSLTATNRKMSHLQTGQRMHHLSAECCTHS